MCQGVKRQQSILDKKLVAHFKTRVGELMADITMVDEPWNFFGPESMLRWAPERKLMVYDLDDEEIVVQTLDSIVSSWAPENSLVTSGLGHNGVLKEAVVIDKIVDWLQR